MEERLRYPKVQRQTRLLMISRHSIVIQWSFVVTVLALGSWLLAFFTFIFLLLSYIPSPPHLKPIL